MLERAVELDSGSRDHLELRALGAHELGDVELLRNRAIRARVVSQVRRELDRAQRRLARLEQVEHRPGAVREIRQLGHHLVGVVEDRADQLVEAERGAHAEHAEALGPLGPLELAVEALRLDVDPRSLDRRTDPVDQRSALEVALAEEVLGTGLERAQRQPDLADARVDHDRHPRLGLAQPVHGLGSGAVGKREIEQHDVDGRLVLEVANRLFERRGALDLDRIERTELGLEPPHHEQRVGEAVLDQEDADRAFLLQIVLRAGVGRPDTRRRATPMPTPFRIPA